jgi:hypothetical protein
MPPAPPAIPADKVLIGGPDGKLYLIPEELQTKLSAIAIAEQDKAGAGGDRDPLYYAHRRYGGRR